MVRRVTVGEKYSNIKGENSLFQKRERKRRSSIDYKIKVYMGEETVEVISLTAEDIIEGKITGLQLNQALRNKKEENDGGITEVEYTFKNGKLTGNIKVGGLFTGYNEYEGQLIYKILEDIDNTLSSCSTKFEFLMRYFLLRKMLSDVNLTGSTRGTVLQAKLGKEDESEKYSNKINSMWAYKDQVYLTYGAVLNEIQNMPIELKDNRGRNDTLGIVYLKVGYISTLMNINRYYGVIRSQDRGIMNMIEGGRDDRGNRQELTTLGLVYGYVLQQAGNETRQKQRGNGKRTLTNSVKGIMGNVFYLTEGSRSNSGASLLSVEGIVSYEDLDMARASTLPERYVKEMPERFLDGFIRPTLNGLERAIVGDSDMFNHRDSPVALFHILYGSDEGFRDYVKEDSKLSKGIWNLIVYDSIENSYALTKILSYVKKLDRERERERESR